MRKSILGIVLALFFSISIPTAFAAPIKGGLCKSYGFLEANTVFECEHLGKVTISQIYEKGWRILFFFLNPNDGTIKPDILVIEEQAKK